MYIETNAKADIFRYYEWLARLTAAVAVKIPEGFLFFPFSQTLESFMSIGHSCATQTVRLLN